MNDPSIEHVTATRAAPTDLDADLERFRRIATALDAQFTIAGIKLGWDSIVGFLIPGVGDLATAAIGTYAIAIARKHGMGKRVIGRLLGNLALDWAVGTVPLVGDLFDVGFKAHQRNLRVLERELAKRRGQ